MTPSSQRNIFVSSLLLEICPSVSAEEDEISRDEEELVIDEDDASKDEEETSEDDETDSDDEGNSTQAPSLQSRSVSLSAGLIIKPSFCSSQGISEPFGSSSLAGALELSPPQEIKQVEINSKIVIAYFMFILHSLSCGIADR